MTTADLQSVHIDRHSNQRAAVKRAVGVDRRGYLRVTLLAELVRASQRVGASAARKTKVRELSSLLRTLAPDEIDTGVHYLSGEIRQGKIGVGYSAVRATASSAAADAETLTRRLLTIAASRAYDRFACCRENRRCRPRNRSRRQAPTPLRGTISTYSSPVM
jgi:hypothetical protein